MPRGECPTNSPGNFQAITSSLSSCGKDSSQFGVARVEIGCLFKAQKNFFGGLSELRKPHALLSEHYTNGPYLKPSRLRWAHSRNCTSRKQNGTRHCIASLRRLFSARQQTKHEKLSSEVHHLFMKNKKTRQGRISFLNLFLNSWWGQVRILHIWKFKMFKVFLKVKVLLWRIQHQHGSRTCPEVEGWTKLINASKSLPSWKIQRRQIWKYILEKRKENNWKETQNYTPVIRTILMTGHGRVHGWNPRF